MEIGVHINNIFIRLHANEALIHYGFQSKEEKNFKINKFIFKNNDILGCGLVYPPTILSEKLPYVFFTQNGKQIGKAVLLNQTNGIYEPYIALKCCSVETNFGNDLNSNPFNYSISKHFLAEEFF
uniref:SPRY domain-containing protein n=1 Tax=Meloidogyne hapla TaxID=6305 RepID=A0A1I8BQS5_MELHA